MNYLLAQNAKGDYDLDGRETVLCVEDVGVIIEVQGAGGAFSATFDIGDKHYYIENALFENAIQEVSELTYDEEGEITHRKHLEELEIPSNHPITKYIFVSGVSLRNEPFKSDV